MMKRAKEGEKQSGEELCGGKLNNFHKLNNIKV